MVLSEVRIDNLVFLLAFLAACVWFNHRCNTPWVQVGPIKEQKFEMHPSRGAYKGNHRHKIDRVYVIAGGSGFVGSWIARYLLLRGEKNVYLFDRAPPPADVLKHGAEWVEIDLMFALGVEKEVKWLHDRVPDGSQIVVYNCSLVRWQAAPNFREDVGVASAEILTVALQQASANSVVLIHVGDTLAHSRPIKNLDRVMPTRELWCQVASPDIVLATNKVISSTEEREREQDRSFSSYAWHQRQVEATILSSAAKNPAVAAAAVLRIQGFVSGHIGDAVLTPCLKSNTAFVHSGKTPLTIVHVEDVVRGCLSLEHQLLDPATRSDFTGRLYTVGNDEVTNIDEVFTYVKERRPQLKVFHIWPVLVFLASWLLSLVAVGPLAVRRSYNSSLYSLSSLLRPTFARFYTLEVGQLPNPENVTRQHDLLKVENNYSLSQTLDMVLAEAKLLDSQRDN